MASVQEIYRSTLIIIFLFFTVAITSAANDMKTVENIYGIKMEQNKLLIKMLSNGCSVEHSFQLIWTDEKLLTVYRVSPDRCRRVPYEKWFTFSLPDKVKTFTVSNIFRVNTN